MTRAEMMRQARESVQVPFSEYLKLKAAGVVVLIFEGKHCPTFYVGRVAAMMQGTTAVRQLVVRGKKNVLDLKGLIRRNISTVNDVVMFFVDRDFDEHPMPGEFPDVYVTRGYAVENECIEWRVLETFLRANFDIADADDDAAIELLKSAFLATMDEYVAASRYLHKMIFVCRRESIRCLPGDEVAKFVEIQFDAPAVTARFDSPEQLAELLQVPMERRDAIVARAGMACEFEALDWRSRWRGKFHFAVVRKFLIHAATARSEGSVPFTRGAKPVVDPVHPGLMGALFAHVPSPECLVEFVRANTQH